MLSIDDILDDILRREGGRFTDNPNDEGGPTKWGITQNTLSQWIGRQATVDEVKAVTPELARRIYTKLYILDPGFGDIADDWTRAFCIDMGVLHGPARAVRMIQRAVGVSVDGVFGPVTRAALAAVDPATRKQALLRERMRVCVRTALAEVPASLVRTTDLQFLEGWLDKRVGEFI
jgi:lysozyme family protein